MKEEKVEFYFKGQKIVGIFHIPEKKNPPAIIMCHGFTGNKDEHGRFIRAAKKFCENGFAVLRFDFRGSGESEGKFENQSYTTEIEDVNAVLNFIENKNIDKTKIGILGLSRGGAVAIVSASKDKRIRCLVTWSAVAFPKDLWSEEEIKKVEEIGYLFFKGFKITKQLWEDTKKYDITQYAKEVKIPFLIIHGDADKKVNISHAKALYESANKPKELKIIKDADHVFRNPEHERQVIDLSLDWFNKWLK